MIKKGEHTLIQAKKQDVRVALITGAARRIGAETAHTLHAAGFKVAIHCHQSQKDAQQLASQLNHLRADSAFVFTEDLLQLTVQSKLVKQVIDWAGQLDLLVNNASLFIRNELQTFNQDEWAAQFAVNVQAPYLLSLLARPFLKKQQGSIINITDIHAVYPLKGYSVYCQTKAALVAQTKALAKEFAPDIRVNGVAPGAIAWPEKENAMSEKIQAKIIERTALKRHGNPHYIAQTVLALADNPFISGQIINVDGGRYI